MASEARRRLERERRIPHHQLRLPGTAAGPLSEGKIEDGVRVECPWHQWRFDVATGKSARGDGHTIAIYECKVEDGEVLIGDVKA